ncbi:MAG: GNAT family N-acetyltransferase [Alphaproteobacteria bacterium]|nr:GNAT family N-acetyltransferase [Alphaproteobacteria bacterium]
MDQVRDFIVFVNEQYTRIGYTLFAAEEKESGRLMGYIGLDPIKWERPLGGCTEIAWRLGSDHWGKGYATEGARAMLDNGLKKYGLKEVISFTSPQNHRSIRVMEKIGMLRDIKGDFSHPKLPREHRLSKQVLYRIHPKDMNSNYHI